MKTRVRRNGFKFIFLPCLFLAAYGCVQDVYDGMSSAGYYSLYPFDPEGGRLTLPSASGYTPWYYEEPLSLIFTSVQAKATNPFTKESSIVASNYAYPAPISTDFGFEGMDPVWMLPFSIAPLNVQTPYASWGTHHCQTGFMSEFTGMITQLEFVYQDGFPAAYGVRADFADCRERNPTYTQFLNHCMTPELIVCSDNYERYIEPNAHIRRIGCPRPRDIRTFAVDSLDPDTEQWPLEIMSPDRDSTSTDVMVNEGFAMIDWRGDDLSYIDVFDQRLDETDHGGMDFHTHGAPNSCFVRSGSYSYAYHVQDPYNCDLEYSDLEQDEERYAGNRIKTDYIASIGIGDRWSGSKSIRYYDVGNCSITLTWRALLNEVVDAIESNLFIVLESQPDVEWITLSPSRVSLTPILRKFLGNPGETKGDLMHITAHITTSVPMVTVTSKLELGIAFTVVPDEGLVLKVEHFDLNTTNDYPLADFLDFLGFDGVNVEERIQAAREMIGSILEDEMAASASQINDVLLPKRVHAKPEGVELILVDDPEEDPSLYALLSLLGFCERPSDLSSREADCYQAIYFPPQESDPPVYMDTKDPWERISGSGDDIVGSGVIY